MTDQVRDAYDTNAELYASLFLHDIERNEVARHWLTRFAELIEMQNSAVADLGCGPGHIVNHLCQLGLNAVGYDLSPGQIAQAHNAFPDLEFHVGDLTALDVADGLLDGIVSRYSLIHLMPSSLRDVFVEWMRVIDSGGPVLISFFGATAAGTHGTPFDHKVVTAYALYPPIIGRLLHEVGFVDIEIGTLPPPEGGRPFDQATVLCRKP